jgi:OmpA-OmpF porin, OOP family
MNIEVLPSGLRSCLRGCAGLALTVFILTACAQVKTDKEPVSAQTTPVSIEAYGEPFTKSKAVAAQQSKFVVYRSNMVFTSQPINIYLNGSYHTSLLKGGFSEGCLAPGSLSMQTILDDASRQHTGKLEPGQRFQFDGGKTIYLRIQESSLVAPVLQVVNPATAQSELKNTRRQIHTVSRAKALKDCMDAEEVAPLAPVVAAVVVPKNDPEYKYALEADTLFNFGKSELRATGYNVIEGLVQKVKKEYKLVEHIRVEGYTDAIGSKKINDKLSQDRANTVAEQLRAGGLTPSKGIRTVGRGSTELIITECGNTPTQKNKQCQAPNRRVEVLVVGIRRAR